MSEYLLPTHVHMCATEHVAIFLDLKRDEYIGLNKEQVSALRTLVRGWPNAAQVQPKLAPEAQALAFAEAMTARGLLTTSEKEGKVAAQVALSTPECALTETYTLSGDVRIRAGHIFAFVYSCAAARLMLRRKTLERVVAQLQATKAARSTASIGLDRLRSLVIVFHRIRQFFYTSHDNCLFDSVAMLRFLAVYDAHPTWVIGVQPKPFMAHAWLQEGKYTLNCSPQTARRFMPIISV